MRASAAVFRLGLAALVVSIGNGAHAQTANAPPEVVDLPVSSGGGTEQVLFIAAPQPRATVILLSGGSGLLAIDNAGNVRPGNNFLVRTRGSWATQGFAVLLPGPPNGASLLGTRHSPAYLAALGAVIDYARSRVNAPVWLIGTSQGSTGAANGAAHLAPKVAGVVLTSSVTRTGRAGETVFDADPGAIAVPVLVVSNAGDGCIVSPPGDGPRLLAALTRSSRKELILVQSSEIQSDPCEALAARLSRDRGNDRAAHRRLDQGRSRPLIAEARRRISAAGSPAMRTILLRLLRPPTSARSRRGRPHSLANNCNSASLARSSKGGAVTETLSTAAPSARCAIPSRRSARARGVSRTTTRTPSAAAHNGPSEAPGNILDDVVQEQPLEKHQEQDQDDRRDVDTAEIRQKGADRAERRLGHPIQKIADDRDGAVVAVNNAESEQPAQDRLADQEPNINGNQGVDQPHERIPIHKAKPR